MASLPPYPDTDDGAAEPSRGLNTGMSRWIYMLWIIGIGLVLLMIALHLTGVLGPGSHQ